VRSFPTDRAVAADTLGGLSKTSTLSEPSSRVFIASLLTVLVGFGIYLDQAASDGVPEQAAAAPEDALARESASDDVRRLVQWAVSTQDYAGMPFVVIDGVGARIYAFDPRGRLRGLAPVVLGANDAALAAPAGRFVANTLASARGPGIVWANDKTRLTLHALTEQASELRPLEPPQAQESASLHVDARFYREYLEALRMQPSVAYVLPPANIAVDQMFGIPPANPGGAAVRAERARSPS
jgi:hypothetical protein